MNSNISKLQATTYPNLAYVCNPFSAPPDYIYQPNNCPANTIRIGDIPKVMHIYKEIKYHIFIYVHELLLVSSVLKGARHQADRLGLAPRRRFLQHC